jgi:hypothetical protein
MYSESTYASLSHLADDSKRYIDFLPTIAFGANLQASWESVAVSFQAGLLNGGPVQTTSNTPTSARIILMQP